MRAHDIVCVCLTLCVCLELNLCVRVCLYFKLKLCVCVPPPLHSPPCVCVGRSQQRYVHYFEQMLIRGVPSPSTFKITSLRLVTIPDFDVVCPCNALVRLCRVHCVCLCSARWDCRLCHRTRMYCVVVV